VGIESLVGQSEQEGKILMSSWLKCSCDIINKGKMRIYIFECRSFRWEGLFIFLFSNLCLCRNNSTKVYLYFPIFAFAGTHQWPWDCTKRKKERKKEGKKEKQNHVFHLFSANNKQHALFPYACNLLPAHALRVDH